MSSQPRGQGHSVEAGTWGPLGQELGPWRGCCLRQRMREEILWHLPPTNLGSVPPTAPKPAGSQMTWSLQASAGKAEKWLGWEQPRPVEVPVITLTFNEREKLSVSSRVCRWENQANKATLVFNETPHPSIRNKPSQGTPALFCAGLAFMGENVARLQGRCLWVWG